MVRNFDRELTRRPLGTPIPYMIPDPTLTIDPMTGGPRLVPIGRNKRAGDLLMELLENNYEDERQLDKVLKRQRNKIIAKLEKGGDIELDSTELAVIRGIVDKHASTWVFGQLDDLIEQDIPSNVVAAPEPQAPTAAADVREAE